MPSSSHFARATRVSMPRAALSSPLFIASRNCLTAAFAGSLVTTGGADGAWEQPNARVIINADRRPIDELRGFMCVVTLVGERAFNPIWDGRLPDSNVREEGDAFTLVSQGEFDRLRTASATAELPRLVTPKRLGFLWRRPGRKKAMDGFFHGRLE